MTLAPGVRLGPHEILFAIDADGMGEVYRARDTRLWRKDGRKPFYLSSEAGVMVVPVDMRNSTIEAGEAQELFRLQDASPISVVLNWNRK